MTDEVLFTQEGQLGLITLNRPSALNALTLNMILAMQRQLNLWKNDERIRAVLVQAAPGNAFCAGGDIRSLYFSGRLSDAEQMQFFWHEYRLNHFIHHLGKPYISLIDGIVMGGGVGISLHGSHPIAADHFVFAMPETGIGFFPDIGSSYLLSRCPGYLGIYLGLTGNRLGAMDALNARLIKQIISSKQIPEVIPALKSANLSADPFEGVDQCLHEYSIMPSSVEPSQIKPAIDVCFAQPTVELIKSSLQRTEGVWAVSIDNSLSQKSPLSLKVTLAQLQKAKGLSLAQCLQMDYDIVSHFMHGKDFYEGVRALLIDKDKNPHWHPECLELVTEEVIEGYFARSHTALEFIE
ncbi:MAG: enoyl-CoA hydratase/isomerase family protein [Legionella sp.]|uniref:enoyl-CoA hydratase/isomerase family protein n=1 Tax=Legionella sp. TaxID=459 RepID=UPI0039E4DD30